jgi:hypothetical protein
MTQGKIERWPNAFANIVWNAVPDARQGFGSAV